MARKEEATVNREQNLAQPNRAERDQAARRENNPIQAAPRGAAVQAINPTEDLMAYLREYARERPEVVALWSFGAGFVLGWKLKLW